MSTDNNVKWYKEPNVKKKKVLESYTVSFEKDNISHQALYTVCRLALKQCSLLCKNLVKVDGNHIVSTDLKRLYICELSDELAEVLDGVYTVEKLLKGFVILKRADRTFPNYPLIIEDFLENKNDLLNSNLRYDDRGYGLYVLAGELFSHGIRLDFIWLEDLVFKNEAVNYTVEFRKEQPESHPVLFNCEDVKFLALMMPKR
jgi:hypothetical protein